MIDPDANLFRPVAVAPTYNNARTLDGVLRDLVESGLPLVVVNDGCDDDSATILHRWHDAGEPERWLVTHPTNLGKAAALQSGFARARELDFTHAVTIDTDGQHDVADIAPLLDLAQRQPDALILGTRSTSTSGYPIASRFGRAISNAFIRMECGARVRDSQCGLRVYPLRFISTLRSCAGRFGFETEIITRAVWAGVPIVEAPVRCIYDVPAGRTSHFRPWRDSLAAIGMHARLLRRRVRSSPADDAAPFPSRSREAIAEIPPAAEPCTPPNASAQTA